MSNLFSVLKTYKNYQLYIKIIMNNIKKLYLIKMDIKMKIKKMILFFKKVILMNIIKEYKLLIKI